jgi:energy-coupling factor transporter ATP-binding protein EcfA2
MELVFLWIDDFNNIKDQSFSFSGNYEINYVSSAQKLTVLNRESPVQNLFNDSFLNVTAVIGKNGSGKSSLISFLKYVFSDDFPELRPYLLIVKKGDELLILNKTRKTNDLLSQNINVESFQFRFVEKNDLFNEINLVTINNSFSLYDQQFRRRSYLDFSLYRLVDDLIEKSTQDLIDYIKAKINQENEVAKINEILNQLRPHASSIFNPIKTLYQLELSNTIDFISKYNHDKLDFIPRSLLINFNYEFYLNLKDYFIGHRGNPNLYFIELVLNENIESTENAAEIELCFKKKLKLYLFLFFSITAEAYNPLTDEIDDVWLNLYSAKSQNETIEIIDGFFSRNCEHAIWKPIKNICEFVQNIDNEFDKYSSLSRFYSSFRFELSPEVFESLNKLINLWEHGDFLFHFSWSGISVGESALLSLFSRLAPSSRNEFVLNENLWIAFDEGDLYLHPEWQREFFNDLHTYLPKLFPEKKIQLFLTSHSPFLVSDLPKENIILLDKNKQTGLCEVVTETKLDKTFGANIHTLLSDAFFLHKGLIGEFAKIKIFELMNEIEQLKDPDGPAIENYKQRIGIIGEPMIRQKLFELLLSKVAPDDNARRLAFLQQEMDKLNRQNN